MLKAIGSHFPFIRLIYECISTPTFSILVKSIPHGFIQSSRSIRHVDLLSPDLFYVAVEYLSLKLEDSVTEGVLKTISMNQPYVSHLLYVDDVMFFLEATVQNAHEYR